MNALQQLAEHGLYRPEFERDNCGWGMIAHLDGIASHELIDNAIVSLERLTHRGAVAADGVSGDGCGLLITQPARFLRKVASEQNIELGPLFAVGNVFLATDESVAAQQRAVLEAAIAAQGSSVAGWRIVPTDTSVCGDYANRSRPRFEQVFVNAAIGTSTAQLNRQMLVARRMSEQQLSETSDYYVSSLSASVLLYKGLVIPKNLSLLYPDLTDPDMIASIAIFHQRFSTNTLPEWRLAQPFRYLAHNGEINTINGNRNWARARASKLISPLLPELQDFDDVVSMSGSDSSSLDNMLEVLVCGGMEMFQAMRLLVPPAWQNVEQMDPDMRAFLAYNALHMEPWDGPAGIVFSDGRYACCTMDRNGLRPARYVVSSDRVVTLASEVGVWDYDPKNIVQKGRLKPGEMIAIDTHKGVILRPQDIDESLCAQRPYARWMQDHAKSLRARLDDDGLAHQSFDEETLTRYEKRFGVSFEERDQVLRVLGEEGAETIGSMGDDTPFPVMSHLTRSLFDNFRQQFAQVTNPPIDPLREAIVMSLETCLGSEGNIFEQNEQGAKRLTVRSPVLSREKLSSLLTLGDKDPAYRTQRIALGFTEDETLQGAVQRIAESVVSAARDGTTVIVLSDFDLPWSQRVVHALLATGHAHHRLINAGLRANVNLIVETGYARDPHHIAVLIGYGATCVCPYLAYECLNGLVRSGEIDASKATILEQNYRKGINKGLLKILSKMGISTIASYRGAQLYEIVGLADEVVDLCFQGTTSRIQGAHFVHLQEDAEALHAEANDPLRKRSQGGLLKFIHGGEYHAYNPDVVNTLQRAVSSGEWSDYQRYADIVDQRQPSMLRDLLCLRTGDTPIPLEEVEPIEDILRRFDSAGMSLGALSPEAHETLAEAMNRLGARSNSGEGGEDKARYGTDKMSKIKQIASGRFGVTPHYLVNAEVLQIKVAQGAKPGEGGQLPGHKVNTLIARLRHSTPGVALISPPPHHDIYSIEDLAQLIYDLKEVNRDALVSVKLVSLPGVGTIAAGVTKAFADLITISGYDGGTGASPLTSVKYAGSPWELGMSETHQVLRANGLRHKVRVQTDGGLKTGLDVIKAAMLGAESFGFGTGPMIAMGCKFLRICHLNNCATGVATQHAVLRRRHFNGNVDKVMHYMRFVAQDVRRHMASLGIRRLDDLIGHTEYLDRIEGQTSRQRAIDLSPLLSNGGIADDVPRRCSVKRNIPNDPGTLAAQMVETCLPAIEAASGGDFKFNVKNTDRSIGARLSGEIAKRYGDHGMTQPIHLRLSGSAGQSFGVWNAGGLHMTLEGDANDYVGKGMAGGQIVIRPAPEAQFDSRSSVIMGNTCLYGATGGKLFASGLAGERFAVRNSGAVAVVEGLGDHGCEYMTGGCVVSLGPTGVNFGAGMTGGMAFILDTERSFVDCYNHELIDIHRIRSEAMEQYRNFLLELLALNAANTHSAWAIDIYENFYRYAQHFWMVKPKAIEMGALMSTLSRHAA